MPDEIKPDAPLDGELPEEDKKDTPKEGDIPQGADSNAAGQGEETAQAAQSEAQSASEREAEATMLAALEQEAKTVDGSASTDGAGDAFPDLSGVKMEMPTANRAEFQQLNPLPGSGGQHNIDLLLDVKMPVSIELGRTEMPISELLMLGPGSVVELSKLAGEPVDLLVNNKVIAKGEVVVVDENFGVRITLLLSPEERLKSLAQE